MSTREASLAVATEVAADGAADLALVAAAVSGDRSAMKALVARLLPVVQVRVGVTLLRRRKLARGRSLRQESEDLVQEVFASLLARRGHVLRSWCPERGASLKSFVGLVAEREVGMILRSGRRSPFTEDATECERLHLEQAASAEKPGGTVSEAPFGARLESRDLLRAVLARLRDRLSDQGAYVFEVLFVEECSIEQAGELTGLSRDALYAWRSRIARQAREIQRELLPGPAVLAVNTPELLSPERSQP